MKKEKELPLPKFVPKRDYKHDKTMIEAVKRAQDQPKMMTVSTKVKDKR